MKLSIAAAVKIIPVSESTLRRDLKSGKVSSMTDKQDRTVVDVAELERVYGALESNESQKNGTDTDKIVVLLEERISELKSQLEKSGTRKPALRTPARKREKPRNRDRITKTRLFQFSTRHAIRKTHENAL